MFKLRDKVASVKNASRRGTVVETGLPSPAGIQWIKVKWGDGSGKWTLADAVREYQASRSVFVPDGVVVLKRPGHLPEVFQQPDSKATWAECQTFLEEILKMFLLKQPVVVV